MKSQFPKIFHRQTVIFIKLTLKMDENYLPNFFLSISRLSRNILHVYVFVDSLNGCELSRSTCMQNFGLLARKLSYAQYCVFYIFWLWAVKIYLHAKFWASRTKIGLDFLIVGPKWFLSWHFVYKIAEKKFGSVPHLFSLNQGEV